MHVDLGPGHRLAVGVEHAAADREGADGIERVGFGFGWVAAGGVRRRVTASRRRLRGLISPRDEGGRGRPRHQAGTQQSGRDAIVSF